MQPQSPLSLALFIAPLLTGLFGVLAGISAQWWRSSRDELRLLCEDFCRLASEAAELGGAYWLLPASDHLIPMSEARLNAYQRRLAGYNALVGERLHKEGTEQIDEALIDFLDALTGGTFGTVDRQPDMDRMGACHDKAADVVLSIREGFIRAVSFRERIYRVVTRAPRKWRKPRFLGRASWRS